MKTILIGLLLLAGLSPSTGHAADASPRRLVFEFPDSAGTIQKMQIDLSEKNSKWTAEVKTKTKKGSVQSGLVSCSKATTDEFNCRREDGGGSFNLIVAPKPKIKTAYFCMNEEGDEASDVITSKTTEPISADGKTVAVSSKDSI